jgi:hypothetical protein
LGSAGESIGFGAIFVAVLAFVRIFLWREITELNARVAKLEAQYDQERRDKHQARNDLAKAVMALELVRRLAAECTCGVLSPLSEIIDRLAAELSTLSRSRRHTDPEETA